MPRRRVAPASGEDQEEIHNTGIQGQEDRAPIAETAEAAASPKPAPTRPVSLLLVYCARSRALTVSMALKREYARIIGSSWTSQHKLRWQCRSSRTCVCLCNTCVFQNRAGRECSGCSDGLKRGCLCGRCYCCSHAALDDFMQQKMSAWEPLLTPRRILFILFASGLIFFVLGLVILFIDRQIVECRVDYTDMSGDLMIKVT